MVDRSLAYSVQTLCIFCHQRPYQVPPILKNDYLYTHDSNEHLKNEVKPSIKETLPKHSKEKDDMASIYVVREGCASGPCP